MSTTTGTSASCACTDAAVPGDPFVRVRYNYGMLLGADDFTTEQNHHVLRHRLHQALLHGHGVVCGLGVRSPNLDPGASQEDPQLRVGSGFAVDRLGRDIWVPRELCLRLTGLQATLWPDGDVSKTASAWIVLRYLACETNPVPAVTPPCAEPGAATTYSRIVDSYRVDLEMSEPAEVADVPLPADMLPPPPPPAEEPPAEGGTNFGELPGPVAAVEDGSPDGLRGLLLDGSIGGCPDLPGLWAALSDAPVTLARITVSWDATNQRPVIEAIDNGVRPLLPNLQTVLRHLLGPSLLRREDPPRLLLVAAETVAGTPFDITLRFSRPVDERSIVNGNLGLTRLGASGWEVVALTVAASASVTDGTEWIATPAAAGWTDTTRWALSIPGAGTTPVVDEEGHPFAGWWDDPHSPSILRGRDATVAGSFTAPPSA